MLDGALDQLPEPVQAGHREGDDRSLVERPIVCRTDSAGSSDGFVAALASRNIGFFTVTQAVGKSMLTMHEHAGGVQ